jgi:hypothetical protein
MHRYVAKTYLAFRECLLPTPRHEMQTEVLADLHGCIENLNTRVIEFAARADRCKQQAIYHLQLAKKEPTSAGRIREQHRARLCMEERKRVHTEHDKALRMAHTLQMQVDNIVATDMDNLIVDTMRAYNMNASRLSLPMRTDQISRLGDELSDRQSELTALQEALTNVTQQMDTNTMDTLGTDDEQLMGELDALLMSDIVADAVPEPSAPKKEPAVPEVAAETLVSLPSVPNHQPRPPTPPPQPKIVVLAETTFENGTEILRRAGDPLPLAG